MKRLAMAFALTLTVAGLGAPAAAKKPPPVPWFGAVNSVDRAHRVIVVNDRPFQLPAVPVFNGHKNPDALQHLRKGMSVRLTAVPDPNHVRGPALVRELWTEVKHR
ncbi:MAG TPA: hypothetical protein VKA14_09325 [Gammaproteobacteria bacterium]|nr:hypothetical protein [Gammaproteobacteria bacterium]